MPVLYFTLIVYDFLIMTQNDIMMSFHLSFKDNFVSKYIDVFIPRFNWNMKMKTLFYFFYFLKYTKNFVPRFLIKIQPWKKASHVCA